MSVYTVWYNSGIIMSAYTVCHDWGFFMCLQCVPWFSCCNVHRHECISTLLYTVCHDSSIIKCAYTVCHDSGIIKMQHFMLWFRFCHVHVTTMCSWFNRCKVHAYLHCMQWFRHCRVCLVCMLQCEHWFKALSVCLNCMCNHSGIFTCVQWFGYLHVCHCHCLQSAKCAMIWKLSCKPTHCTQYFKNCLVYLQSMQCLHCTYVCNNQAFFVCRHDMHGLNVVVCAYSATLYAMTEAFMVAYTVCSDIGLDIVMFANSVCNESAIVMFASTVCNGSHCRVCICTERRKTERGRLSLC